MTKIIKVGFDFDGVLYYNLTRCIRPLIFFVKKYLLKKRTDTFYVPKNRFKQKLLNFYFNTTSYKPNIGFLDFLELTKNKKYQIYIITGRLSFLSKKFNQVILKYKLKDKVPIFQNSKNEQPHLFKKRLIRELELDYYVEDNWDIVNHLTTKTKTKIIWVHNIIDRIFIKYQPQVSNLKEAIKLIKKS